MRELSHIVQYRLHEHKQKQMVKQLLENNMHSEQYINATFFVEFLAIYR